MAVCRTRPAATERATRRLRSQLGLEQLPVGIGRLLPQPARVSDAITKVIQDKVHAYAGPADGWLGKLISAAVRAAIQQFVAVIEKRPTAPGAVNELFARLGREEARAEHDLDAMHAAFGVAKGEAERALYAGAEAGLSAEVQVMLGNALRTYMQALMAVVADAHRAEKRRLETDPERLRGRLLGLLLSGEERVEIARVAGRIGWPVPDTVLICRYDSDRGARGRPSLPGRVLLNEDGERITALIPADLEDAARAKLARWPRRGPLAVTWPVPLSQVGHAAAWASRLLELVDDGKLAESPVVHCGDVPPVLLQRIDPVLRGLADELLAPMNALDGNYRQSLCRTLLYDLLTRSRSASKAGNDLGIHEHTVRNHRRALREILGSHLDDPASVTALILALPELVDHGVRPDESGAPAPPGPPAELARV